MLKRILISIVLAGFPGPFCFAQESKTPESAVVLTVEVVNKTKNGTDVTDDPVTIRIFHHNQLLDTLQGKVDDTGKAVFQNVTAGEHFVAVASVRHNNMNFDSHAVVLDRKQKIISTLVQVFEYTSDRSKLSVGTHHFILETYSDTLAITEYMQIKNNSDMAITSDKKDSRDSPIALQIMLPHGFKNFKCSKYFEQQAVVVTEHGFYDTMAVPPGDYQAAFEYTLDINSDTMNITKQITLPTSHFMLFAQLPPTINLQSADLEETQITTANGKAMRYYKRTNLDKDGKITFNITGFNTGFSSVASWPILAAVFGIVLILAIIRAIGQKANMETSNNQ